MSLKLGFEVADVTLILGILGDVIHFNIFGTRILYVNSFAAVNDLFDKKSSVYSGRPRLPMIKEVSVFPYLYISFNISKLIQMNPYIYVYRNQNED